MTRPATRLRGVVGITLLAGLSPTTGHAQRPDGLAADALANPAFTWIHRSAAGVHLHFLAGSYPAAHQDSLAERTLAAKRHALSLLGEAEFAPALDVFFVESRSQMEALIGARATGFADMEGRAVFLMTNPRWRAFERHELMHVLARQAWGVPAEPSAWLQEGLAQFADGHCAGYPNEKVLVALAGESGLTDLDALVGRFRQLDDLSAYLQAASLVGYLYRTLGRNALRVLWSKGVDGAGPLLPKPLREIDAEWRRSLPPRGPLPLEDEVTQIRARGCG